MCSVIPCYGHGFCSPLCILNHWLPPGHNTYMPTLNALIALQVCSVSHAFKPVFCLCIFYLSLRLPAVVFLVSIFCYQCLNDNYGYRNLNLYCTLLLPINSFSFTLMFILYLLLNISIVTTLNRRTNNSMVIYQSLHVVTRTIVFCGNVCANNDYIFIVRNFRVLPHLSYLRCFVTMTRLIICTRLFLFELSFINFLVWWHLVVPNG